MKIGTIIIAALLFSCNQAPKTVNENPVLLPVKPAVPEDTVITKLRATVLSIETEELKATNILKQIMVDSVQYNMISMKAYYSIQKEGLAKIVHFSTNKEKTTRALDYLEKMIKTSTDEPIVFAVQFHLNALLANSTLYNEHHVKYLTKNLSQINIVFP